jgi:polyisoprenoid-binding protein YceI
MKRLALLAGVLGMVAWTALGAIAWSRIAREAETPATDADRDARALAALTDEVETLHADVRALAQGFGESLQALHDELAARADEHAAGLLRELGRRLDAADAVGSAGSSAHAPDLELALDGDEPVEVVAVDAPAPVEAPPSQSEPVTATEPAPAAPRHGSFLAFPLPSDEFRFDERRTWSVLPALSRAGFDAKTTLHDFSGVTSAVAGELECALADPDEKPHARIVVEAARLESGDAKRDEAMREHLAVDEHATLEFVLTGFEPRTVDAGDLRVAGTAEGTMTIRGVTRAVSMPVELAVDDARRLSVEGEMTLDLETFGVPVPNKLGLITMEKDVKVWLSLRLRANPRSEG